MSNGLFWPLLLLLLSTDGRILSADGHLIAFDPGLVATMASMGGVDSGRVQSTAGHQRGVGSRTAAGIQNTAWNHMGAGVGPLDSSHSFLAAVAAATDAKIQRKPAQAIPNFHPTKDVRIFWILCEKAVSSCEAKITAMCSDVCR